MEEEKLLLIYDSPSGESIKNPDVKTIENLILHESEDYWCSGAAQGGLSWFKDEREWISLLEIVFEPSQGFWLKYTDSDVICVSLGSGDYKHENAVTAYIGGEPLLLPTKWFVKPQEAWFAVEEFCQTGGMTIKINWGRQGEQNWDYGEPEGWL
ncbi:hypothetical protein H1P_730013 [Hyella patelloides LEGE 07179]|uniref:Uncharacterized protein n=1 Tax=Hyella patelloides LEGE 07179 TaxID=945734 RepID=A0A563W3L2_9CYAN|nr:hypothetical protein [Hyella patelloides]VEP18272.1 hypothetical protein H1P_730013 [Hyella patelloides LEGE 07179]